DVPPAACRVEGREKAGAPTIEVAAYGGMELAFGPFRRWGEPQSAQSLPVIQRHLAVLGSERAPPDPHEIAGGRQSIQTGGGIETAGGEDIALQDRCRDRRSLQAPDGVTEGGVTMGWSCSHALPLGEETPQRRAVDRFDLGAERSQGPALQPPEDLGVDPFPAAAARPEGAADDPSFPLEGLQAVPHHADREPELGGGVVIG